MLEILFEDNHLIAVVKPGGLPTQPTPDSENSLETLVKAYIKEKYQKPGAVFLHAIHRLDKAASGIVLFARTSKALSRMNEEMRDGAIQKEYTALVAGHLKQKSATLENYLLHGEHRAIVVPKSHSDGKKSLLLYDVLKETKDQSLLRIELYTGRYHQIRAQLSHLGHPIVGDKKYGSTLPFHPGIALHASKLAFNHPVTKEKIVLQSAFSSAGFAKKISDSP